MAINGGRDNRRGGFWKLERERERERERDSYKSFQPLNPTYVPWEHCSFIYKRLI